MYYIYIWLVGILLTLFVAGATAYGEFELVPSNLEKVVSYMISSLFWPLLVAFFVALGFMKLGYLLAKKCLK